MLTTPRIFSSTSGDFHFRESASACFNCGFKSGSSMFASSPASSACNIFASVSWLTPTAFSDNLRLRRLLKKAKLRQEAALEDIDYGVTPRTFPAGNAGAG
ncbi:MAG: hypothetical protein HYX81_03580 [Chloroflexi bacterium]|nr:hypothetical protein [Chloroflexota bacterium]